MEGKILGSRYRITKRIGEGGFGKTYLAEDIGLPDDNRCVVKHFYPTINDAKFLNVARRLFKKEGETLNKLGHHDQIPYLLAYFEQEKQFYLVQQYIEGHSLSQELILGQSWPEAKVIELLRDCLGILDFIHNQGVIHRDVKPDNLIRRQQDSKLVLVDFGTVKEFVLAQTQTIPSTVAVGTKGYMPIEQARGKPRTASDIYALGVIAIQALTGVHPLQLQEDDNGELLWQYEVYTTDPQAQISPQLTEILTKMVRYHFQDRYQSAKEVLAALVSWENNGSADSEIAPDEYTSTVKFSHFQLNNSVFAAETASNIVDATEAKSTPNHNLAADSTHQANPSPPAAAMTPIPGSSLSEDSMVESNPKKNQANCRKQNTSNKSKTIAALGLAIALGGAATGVIYFLNQKTTENEHNSIDQQVKELNEMEDNNQYGKCYELVTQARSDATTIVLPEDQRLQFEASCGLGMAEEQAQLLRFSEALEIAKKLPKDTSLDPELQRSINESIDQWSEKVLEEATEIYEKEGKLQAALELTGQIPQNSSVQPQALDLIENWQREYETNKNAIAAAENALTEKRWQDAKQEAAKINSSSSDYWQQKARAIIEQAEEAAAASSPSINRQTETTPSNTGLPQTDSTPQPNPAVEQPEQQPLRELDDTSPTQPPPQGGSLRDL